MICDEKKEWKFKRFYEYFIKLCSSENGQIGVKGGLKHKKRQYISEITRRHYHLQKKLYVQYMNIKKKMLVSGTILKTMILFLTITSGQIICWLLLILLLDGYHIAFLHV